MIDDPDLLMKRAAYADTLRRLYRIPRILGFIWVAAGFALLVWSRMSGPILGGPMIVAGALLVAGWCCLFYSLIQRRRWAAAHPFDPNV